MNNEITEMSATDSEWLQRTWRPAVGVTYIIINIFDFIIFPILWSFVSIYIDGKIQPWQPLTLEATGLFHLSFGAILGVAAWSRGQEKLAGVDSYSDSRMRRSWSRRRDDFGEEEFNEPSSTFRGEQ